jgi:hypothetical protein
MFTAKGINSTIGTNVYFSECAESVEFRADAVDDGPTLEDFEPDTEKSVYSGASEAHTYDPRHPDDPPRTSGCSSCARRDSVGWDTDCPVQARAAHQFCAV